jgi:hypothetical protein
LNHVNAIFGQSCKFSAPGQKTVLIHASSEPVSVPDWVRDTPTYKHSLAGGKIIELSGADDGSKIAVSRAEYEQFLAWKAASSAALPAPAPVEQKLTAALPEAEAMEEEEDEPAQDAVAAPNGKKKKKA